VVAGVFSLVSLNMAAGVLVAIVALASPVFVALVLDRERARNEWPDELV
jgi:hypothetical protein